MRVVIVDDAVFARSHLRSILEGAGFEVVAEAANGREAVALYERLKPDLVTMDLVMPELDGISTIESIRQIDPKARVLVCSSITDEAVLMRALAAGAYDYVAKPIDALRLLDAAKRARA
jgi:two-component system chemotaxis response regulator CheY